MGLPPAVVDDITRQNNRLNLGARGLPDDNLKAVPASVQVGCSI